jgi:hypothetical protein
MVSLERPFVTARRSGHLLSNDSFVSRSFHFPSQQESVIAPLSASSIALRPRHLQAEFDLLGFLFRRVRS